MSTHDDIELPPLPVPRTKTDGGIELFAEYSVREYARAAIEPYKQRIEELEAQLEAIGAGGVSGQPITSQSRSEPVACFKCGHANHGGECVNVAPQPAEPTNKHSLSVAEPVKVPSDSEIMWEWANTPNTGDMRVDLSVFARALLARYGQTTEPEGWQLVPKELIDFLDAREHLLPVEDRHVLSIMLEAAPKFGEE